jgi:hypothetical protein
LNEVNARDQFTYLKNLTIKGHGIRPDKNISISYPIHYDYFEPCLVGGRIYEGTEYEIASIYDNNTKV